MLPAGFNKLIQTRNKAQKHASETQNPDDWRAFKNLCNTLNARIKFEKKEWEQKKLDITHLDPSSLW